MSIPCICGHFYIDHYRHDGNEDSTTECLRCGAKFVKDMKYCFMFKKMDNLKYLELMSDKRK